MTAEELAAFREHLDWFQGPKPARDLHGWIIHGGVSAEWLRDPAVETLDALVREMAADVLHLPAAMLTVTRVRFYRTDGCPTFQADGTIERG